LKYLTQYAIIYLSSFVDSKGLRLMDILRNGSRIPDAVLAAQAGLEAIGMHIASREQHPNDDGTPREELTTIQIVSLGQKLTLPIVIHEDIDPKL
jgi:hypothetical protein